MRISEAMRLRVKDIDFANTQIEIRDSKSDLKTKEIYTHVRNPQESGVVSPLDRIRGAKPR